MKTIYKSNINGNPYKTTWVEFVPASGIATKHDIAIFDPHIHIIRGTATHYRWFPSKQHALDFLASIDSSKLDKSYTCYLFTDKQFGMAKASEGYKIHYTSKQLANPIYITK